MWIVKLERGYKDKLVKTVRFQFRTAMLCIYHLFLKGYHLLPIHLPSEMKQKKFTYFSHFFFFSPLFSIIELGSFVCNSRYKWLQMSQNRAKLSLKVIILCGITSLPPFFLFLGNFGSFTRPLTALLGVSSQYHHFLPSFCLFTPFPCQPSRVSYRPRVFCHYFGTEFKGTCNILIRVSPSLKLYTRIQWIPKIMMQSFQTFSFGFK